MYNELVALFSQPTTFETIKVGRFRYLRYVRYNDARRLPKNNCSFVYSELKAKGMSS